MIIHTRTAPLRKTQNTAKRQQLQASWDELLDKYPVHTKASTTKQYVPPKPIRRTTALDNAPSVDTGLGSTTKAEPQQYTGDAMIGIGQLHKSNAVPVFRHDDAEALAKMRR